jgi:hypothetical protein
MSGQTVPQPSQSRGSTLGGFFRSAELILVLVMWVLVAGVFWLSRTYPNVPWSMGGPPAMYPRIVALLILGLSLAVIVEGLRAPTRLALPDGGMALRVIGGLVIFVLALTAMPTFGFRIVAAGMLLALMAAIYDWRAAKARDVVMMVALAIIGAFLLAYLFEDLAGRRLPRGTIL